MVDSTPRDIIAVDLFCGAGGFSQGLKEACDDLGYGMKEAAINHWQCAIDTHEINHPDAHQYHSKIEQLHPPDVIDKLVDGDGQDTNVDLLTAGPECTHFSSARGGKPVEEQKRMSPWNVLDWLEKLNVDSFIIENVSEIQLWGPVIDGQPSRDGTIFEAWTNALNKMGYSIDWTTLNAADYGDATSRERFFLIGQKQLKASFPDPTHTSNESVDLPSRRPASKVIDWSDLGGSLWTRDLEKARITPLKNTTMKRIADGLRRHCSKPLTAFADVLETIGREELQTLRENRVIPLQHAESVAELTDHPFLVTAPDTEPDKTLLLRQQDGAHPIDVTERSVPTITTSGGHSIATLEIQSLETSPTNNTTTTHNPTVTDQTITRLNNLTGVTKPIRTPFIDDYEGNAKSIDAPLGTITSRDKFALCVPELWPWGLDIRYRMLQPHELKLAQGFPEDYELSGTKTDRTEQIGNAVPVGLAKHLCKHVLTSQDPNLSSYGGGIVENNESDTTIPDYHEIASSD